MQYRNLYTVYTKIVGVCINQESQIMRENCGTKNNVIRQVVYGNFASQKLDAAKRIKKRRCGLLCHST